MSLSRGVTGRHKLPPGTYYIIPHGQTEFLLRVFTEKPIQSGYELPTFKTNFCFIFVLLFCSYSFFFLLLLFLPFSFLNPPAFSSNLLRHLPFTLSSPFRFLLMLLIFLLVFLSLSFILLPFLSLSFLSCSSSSYFFSCCFFIIFLLVYLSFLSPAPPFSPFPSPSLSASSFSSYLLVFYCFNM